MHSGFKGLLHLSGNKEAVALLGFAAIRTPQPPIVLGVLRIQLDRLFAIRDCMIVVSQFVIRTQRPVVQRGILGRLGESSGHRPQRSEERRVGKECRCWWWT